MKNSIRTVLGLCALLCALAVTACTSDGPAQGADTDTAAVTETVTEPAATGTDRETATETAAEAETETATETETETATETGTATETTAETETEAPRFDYMANDVLPLVDRDTLVYKGLTLTLPADLQVTHEDVEAYVLSQRVKYRVAGDGSQVTDQPLRMGDSAFIYYRGEKDGAPFEGGSNMEEANPYELVLGSGTFIPGFEEGLVGVVPANTSKDEPFALHVTFPEGYKNADLAGQEVIFYVAVAYAVPYELPAYDRAFVVDTLKYTPRQESYADDAALIAEFEAELLARMEEAAEESVNEAKNTALWDHLLATVTCVELPAEEVAYYDNYFADATQSGYDSYVSYYGEAFLAEYPTVDAFAIAYLGLPEDADWPTELDRLATEEVKREVIIHAVAEAEGMETVTDEAFEAEIQYYIDYYAAYGVTVTREEVIAEIGEEELRLSACRTAVGEWMLEQITFTYA